jgi:hypothetical protein
MDNRTATPYWDSVMIETARKHPLMMAAWLLADAALDAMIGLQDSIEERLRASAASITA